jgi:hypothetical protein
MAELHIGEDDDSGLLGHLYEMSIILRPYRVGNLHKSLLVGGAVGKGIADINTAITPSPCEAAAFRNGRIVDKRISYAGFIMTNIA